MTAKIATILKTIVDTWEALTPPDRTGVTYRVNEAGELGSDVSDDRTFLFSLPSGPHPVAERGPEMTHCAWTFDAVLFLMLTGRSTRSRVSAVADEAVLLRRALDKAPHWGAGLIDVNAVSYTHLTLPTTPSV